MKKAKMIYMEELEILKINEVRRKLDDYPSFSETVRRLIELGIISLESKIKDEPDPEFSKEEASSTEEEFPSDSDS